MPRKRWLCVEFWDDPVLLSRPKAALLYVCIWTHADDNGIHPRSPATFRVKAFGHMDPPPPLAEVEELWGFLEEHGYLVRFDGPEGGAFVAVKPRGWERWQLPIRKPHLPYPHPPWMDGRRHHRSGRLYPKSPEERQAVQDRSTGSPGSGDAPAHARAPAGSGPGTDTVYESSTDGGTPTSREGGPGGGNGEHYVDIIGDALDVHMAALGRTFDASSARRWLVEKAVEDAAAWDPGKLCGMSPLDAVGLTLRWSREATKKEGNHYEKVVARLPLCGIADEGKGDTSRFANSFEAAKAWAAGRASASGSLDYNPDEEAAWLAKWRSENPYER